VDRTLYGATEDGGSAGVGTIFSVTLGGTEKVLHTFYYYEGAFPNASLIDVNVAATWHKG
jgi:uncharacterized repeat protein (TIGR03803 family)